MKDNKAFLFLKLFLALTLGNGPLYFSSYAQENPLNEYQIKAVFIFNFAQFIEWPPNAFTTSDSPFIIGIIGKDPFGEYLDQTVQDEKINGHPMIVKHFSSIEEMKECHILFINPKKTDITKQVLLNLKSKNILTVGDFTDFTKLGGMIGFFIDSNKIRIQINLEVAKNADLNISSKLLRLAKIVSSEDN